jgi:hypothetical protein
MMESTFRSALRASVLTVALAAITVGTSACGGGEQTSGVASAKLPKGVNGTIEHQSCDEDGEKVETLDVNNDGKADIRTVIESRSGQVICRIVDLNHDAKPDLYEYYDRMSGTIRRREFCFDDSGVVNAVEYYEGGKLVRREKDTTGQRRIDTWDYFDPAAAPDPRTGNPRPIRRERDTDGNGQIDQWWLWEGDRVSIATDKNGDGNPDPEATVILGASGSMVSDAVPAAPAAVDAGAAPTAADADGGAASAPPAAISDAGPPSSSTPQSTGGTPDGGAKK